MNKKRSFLLIEAMISMSLLAMLLGVMSFWFVRMHHSKIDHAARFSVFSEEEHAYKNLRYLFDNISSSCIKDYGARGFSFDFQRPITAPALLSGKVHGTVRFDSDSGQIILYIESCVNESVSCEICVLDSVQDAHWTFQSLNSSNEEEVQLPCNMTIIRAPVGKLPERTLSYIFTGGR